MKSLKIFRIGYILNFSLFGFLALFYLIHFFSERNHSFETYIGFFSITFSFLFTVALFTRSCIDLFNANTNEYKLSKKMMIKGKIVGAIFSFINLLFFIGSFFILKMIFTDDFYSSTLLPSVSVLLITIVSLYNVIVYWLMLKRNMLIK